MKFRLTLIAMVFFALSAGNSRSAYGAPPTEACSLLTTAQVSAVLGVTVEAGKPFPPTHATICHWGSAVMGKNRGVMITLQDAAAFAYAKMPVGHGIVKIPVSGIGDDAVYGTTPGFATTLTVKKGNVVFVVHVSGFPDDEIKAKEKALALDVLAKL